jgi:hypothetical protein
MVGLRFRVFIFDEFDPRATNIHHGEFEVRALLVDPPFRSKQGGPKSVVLIMPSGLKFYSQHLRVEFNRTFDACDRETEMMDSRNHGGSSFFIRAA